jgi:TRAP-type C4-dicarboxylate transport system permease small subunit
MKKLRSAAIFLDRISSFLGRVALWGAVLALLVMVFAAGYQVIARYIFHAPPVWTEELARRSMVWAGMLGASVAFRDRSDPNLFPELLGIMGKVGKALGLIRAVGVVIFAFPILYFSVFGPNLSLARGFLGRSLDRSAEMIDLSMIWFTAAVPIAFILIVIHAIAHLAMRFADLEKPGPSLQEDALL